MTRHDRGSEEALEDPKPLLTVVEGGRDEVDPMVELQAVVDMLLDDARAAGKDREIHLDQRQDLFLLSIRKPDEWGQPVEFTVKLTPDELEPILKPGWRQQLRWYVGAKTAWVFLEPDDSLPASRVLVDAQDEHMRWRKAAANGGRVTWLKCITPRCKGVLYAADDKWVPKRPDVLRDGRIVCLARCDGCEQVYEHIYPSQREHGQQPYSEAM